MLRQWYKSLDSQVKRDLKVDDVFRSVHGMYVIRNGYRVDPAMLDGFLEDFAIRWEAATKWEHIRLVLDKLTLVWTNPSFRSDHYDMDLSGLALIGRKVIIVAHDDSLERSALAHEIGHQIMWYWKKDASEEGLRDFAVTHDLPY